MSKFDSHLFHCSSIGSLMTDPRSKSDGLSETCKAELMKIWIAETYGRIDDIENKYLMKGTMTEEDGITLYSEVKEELFFKNKERFNNEFITGEPDIIKDRRVKDIKSCWSIHTFFAKLHKPEHKGYKYQLNGYAEIIPGGVDGMDLVYVLVNNPDVLIQQEKDRLRYKMGIIDPDANPEYLEACAHIEKNSLFDDIPKDKRYIEFEIERMDMEPVYTRLKECRNFLNSLN